ncbi:cytochrome P450 [Nocardia sp. CA-136227]|uniref:cytochrome P450 n=1 Tax=Nocardia sp. CA-136227 TaxID=3239979 RepID=UPI003D952858
MTTMNTVPEYPFGVATRLDLHPNYTELRGSGPTRVRMPFGGEAWLVTKYQDAREVLSDNRFSRARTLGTDIPRTRPIIQQTRDIFTMDPPDHARLRRLVAKAFTPRRVATLEPRVSALVNELLTNLIARGAPGDLAAGLAWPLSTQVICELMGVPVNDQKLFREWADKLLALGDTGLADMESARTEIYAYLTKLIGHYRNHPADNLLSALVAARDEDDSLIEDEIVSFAVTLLVAGYETTASQISNFVYLLLTRAGLWERLLRDPSLIPDAVEELLRFVPFAASADFARVATEDLMLGGVKISAGDAVVVLEAAANRDPAVFDSADDIDFDRPTNPHLAFGHGVHQCIGSALARMELRVALETLVDRLPGLSLAVPAEAVEWRENRLVRGVQQLPVRW